MPPISMAITRCAEFRSISFEPTRRSAQEASSGGDDCTPSIWQHAENFEPSLVYPFAAYFAESQSAPLVILPFNQFVVIKPTDQGNYFRVIDTTQKYGERTLLSQVRKRN